MTDTEAKSRNPNDPLAGAVAGWDSEGGAPQTAVREKRVEQAPLTEDEEHVLQRLGAAVLVQWNDLPSRIQRQLFDHAASMGEPRYTTQLRGEIARFLNKHKDDTQASAS
jgi:hypothetical protein